MTALYELQGVRLSSEELQQRLPDAHRARARPNCMCIPSGVPMYIACYGGEYIVKRMPETGARHDPTCESYEPEPGLSGRADLGGAISIDDELRVHVALNFALSRRPRGVAPETEPTPPPALEPMRQPRVPKCSLEGLVHLLWEEAGFNRWHPNMQGKRGQWTLHKYLTREAQRVVVKGVSLAERLYVPEVFRLSDKDQIAERRLRHLAFLTATGESGEQPLGLAIGEFLRVDERYGKPQVLIKHAPDAPIRIQARQWERIQERFRAVLKAGEDSWPEHQRPHVVIAAIVSSPRDAVYQLEAVHLMLVSNQWIALQGKDEIKLVEHLIADRRVFDKPLTYGAKESMHFPNALLLDCGAQPVHAHFASLAVDEKVLALKQKLAQERGPLGWLWDDAAASAPTLPPSIRPGR